MNKLRKKILGAFAYGAGFSVLFYWLGSVALAAAPLPANTPVIGMALGALFGVAVHMHDALD